MAGGLPRGEIAAMAATYQHAKPRIFPIGGGFWACVDSEHEISAWGDSPDSAFKAMAVKRKEVRAQTMRY